MYASDFGNVQNLTKICATLDLHGHAMPGMQKNAFGKMDTALPVAQTRFVCCIRVGCKEGASRKCGRCL